VPLVVGATLIAGGCGSGVAPSTIAAARTAPTEPVKVVRGTPQSTAQTYIEGLTRLNGNAICSVLDSSLRRAMVNYTVSNHVAIPGVPCATVMHRFAAASTAPNERGGKLPLPTLHVQIKDGEAEVRYIGTASHKEHTFTLVKSPGGWLIDKINGNG
jgi:hypothetical protein